MPQESPPESETVATQQIAFINGDWIDASELSISMSDLGFRQGVTAVERLRTYHQSIFQKHAHLDRWQATTNALEISGLPSRDQTSRLLDELLQRNKSVVDQWGESGITIVATPGIDHSTPTFAMHLVPLDLAKVQQHQKVGQPLIVTDVVQPPPESWARSLKVRCRLHYYRADLIAGRKNPNAIGVLLDGDGTITETSVANIAIVLSQRIVSPPPDRVLGGVTQTVVQRLATELNIGWDHQPISVDQLGQADEILLMGTNGGIWFASSVDGKAMASSPADIYPRLLAAFQQQVKRLP